MTITVAVTGGIGAGKSTVSGLLSARGAVVVDSDQLAREVVGPGTPGLAAVVDTFGASVRAPDGSLDRSALASIVFADVSARRRLEAITHPAIRARFTELQAAAPRGSVVVNDIPLLVSRSAAAAFHLVIGVGAPEATRLARLVGRGMSESDARSRIAAQISDDERRLLCDVWVDNSKGPGEVRKRADLVWSRLADFAANVEAGRPASRGGPVLVPYRADWPAQADRLVARLHHLLGPDIRVDHIGSTAVPGLAATDVIDLQVGVPDLDTADDLADLLTGGGFPLVPGGVQNTVPAFTAGTSDQQQGGQRMHANADPGRTVNLYLRVRDSPHWPFALRLRDWLRADPAGAQDYLVIKRLLAERCAGDTSTDGYAMSKADLLEEADRRSATWAAASGWQPV